MQLELKKDVCQAMGLAHLKEWGLNEDSYRWKHGLTIDLTRLTRARAGTLRELLVRFEGLPTIKARIRDIDTWLTVLAVGTTKVRCKKVKHFPALVKQHLKSFPDHWLYENRPHSEVWQPRFVEEANYHPAQFRDGYKVHDEFARVDFCWVELGEVKWGNADFYLEDVQDMTAGLALANKGYVVETPELRAAYEAHKARYDAIHDKVGLQFTAVGLATDDVPNPTHGKNTSWWGRSTGAIRLDKHGDPARVVVDLLREDDKDESSSDKRPTDHFWKEDACELAGSPTDDDRDLKPGDEDDDQEQDKTVKVDLPLAPALVCFDLRRQVRLRIYVDQLAEYAYRTDLGDKLVLPREVRELVTLLVSHRSGFQDIIGGKGGGAVILCAGPPGTGKTLTSEVYSEAMERPLYSVQCSQLGTDPDTLEKELLQVFARAVRWNAILLLDEADVYVRTRGDDLTQNAIVGVFLRVLEYYAGVLFMTTNRADLVDDAVASRCLARIDYTVPTATDQKKIWHVLLEVSGLKMDPREVDRTVAAFPGLCGRDVKNLLKLASLVVARTGEPITAKTIAFVKQFKPTSDSMGPQLQG